MSVQELFSTGQIAQAVEIVTADVKKKPGDLDSRALLAQLLCFKGELERADKQLDVISTQSPESAMTVALFRQLIRGEQARVDFHSGGRVPEFLTEPSESLRLVLKAGIALRENHPAEAVELLTEAEEKRPEVKGTCNGKPFEDFRDLDDFYVGFFEVLTSTGKYYWIPTEKIRRIEFHEPGSPRDLFWREVEMDVDQGPEGVVYLPVIYYGSSDSDDEIIQRGLATDWFEPESGPVRGIGQRMFLMGEEDISMMDLQELEFEITDEASV
jgi:type VI secretion system protein ImpE